ncbi:unnamed protein product [Urochloa decumbens]|uniref:Uncharacterized protein n=1 Tax=Urochloa decumbens TaxID=240449 RepID=A0ABC9C149_9POAL
MSAPRPSPSAPPATAGRPAPLSTSSPSPSPATATAPAPTKPCPASPRRSSPTKAAGSSPAESPTRSAAARTDEASTGGPAGNPLSPAARPFYLGESSSGRPKMVRWSDADEEALDLVDYELSPSPSPRPSYLEVARGSSPAAAEIPPAVGVEAAGPATDPPRRSRRRRPSRRARKRRPAPARPASALPASAGRVAPPPEATQRRRPRIDEDGFQEAMSRSTRRRLRQAELAESRAPRITRGRAIPPELADRDCWMPRAPPLAGAHRSSPAAAAHAPGGNRRLLRTDGPPTPEASLAPSRTPSPSTDRGQSSAPGGSRTVAGRQRFARTNGATTPPGSEAPSSTPSPPDSPPFCHYSAADSTGSRRAAEAEPERCYVDRSPAMEEEEARLRFAIIAQVGNASREFSPADVSAALAEATGLNVDCYPAVPSYPDSYLIVCSTQAARDRALSASPAPLAATFLSLRPWTRLVRANSTVLYHKVGIEMDGIPEHAWDLDTASKLLARHAWIERLDPATATKSDMSTFKLTAWTADPLAIPGSKTLCIAEPELRVTYSDDDMQRIFGNLEPYLRQKRILRYPVHIHLRSIADYRSRTPSTSSSSPSEDGDSGPDGNPRRSYGHRTGTGPRLTGFPRREIRDADTAGAAADGAGGGTTIGGSRGAREDPSQQQPVGDQSKAATTLPTSVTAADQARGPPENSKSRCATSTGGVGATTVSTTAHHEGAEQEAATEAVASVMGTTSVVEDLAATCVIHAWATQTPVAFDPMLIEAEAKGPAQAPKADSIAPTSQCCPALSRTAPVCPPAAEACTPPGDPPAAPANAIETVTHATAPTTGVVDDPAGPTATVLATPIHCKDNNENHEMDQDGWMGLQGTESPDGPESPPGFSRAARLADDKLLQFTSQVQSKIRSPLAPRPAKTKRAAPSTCTRDSLPKRSLRLASHPLANVQSSKRAEVVLMRRFDMIPEATTPNTEGRKAYEKLYRTGVQGEHFDAMDDLLPALRNVSPLVGMQA